MSNDRPKGRAIRVGPAAKSTSSTDPAFVAKPTGAPVYHGFPILDSSEIDGWRLGIITDPNDPEASESLDGFIVAPDDSRAGIVWDRNATSITKLIAASPGRWGVYSVPLSRSIHNDDDLVAEFRRVLPKLKELWSKAHDA